LSDSFTVLKFERSSNPRVFGSSVFGLQNVYIRFLRFVVALRRSQAKQGSMPVYVATVDIRHCYDTIPHYILCDHVLPLVVRHPSYAVGRYTRLSWHSLRPNMTPRLTNVRYHQFALPLSHFGDLAQGTHNGESTANRLRCHRCIFIHQDFQSVVDRKSVLSTIREHITQNLLKVDGRYLRTQSGIPQGAVTSVLLCGVFYSHLENHVLRPVIFHQDVNDSRRETEPRLSVLNRLHIHSESNCGAQ